MLTNLWRRWLKRGVDKKVSQAKILKKPRFDLLEDRLAPTVTIVANLTDNTSAAVLPGGTINYSATIQNTGNTAATVVHYGQNLDANTNLVPGTINASPLAFDDSYTAVGNTLLRVGGSAGSGPEVFIAGGSVLTDGPNDDTDFTGTNFNPAFDQINGISAFDSSSLNGGTVTMNTTTGTFTYLPAVGFTGTDSFTYTISDGALTGVGTVTITVKGVDNTNNATAPVVWYVNSSYADENGASDGRSTRPFKTLTPVNGGSDADDTGDVIYVHTGSGSYTGGFTLEASQKLQGQGDALVVNATTLQAAGTRPTIAQTTGAAIALSTNNDVRGLNVSNTGGTGISGSAVGTLTLNNIGVTATANSLNLTTSGTVTATGSNTLNTSSGTGLALANVTIGNAGMTFDSVTASGSSVGIFLNTVGQTATSTGLDINGGTISGHFAAEVQLSSVSADVSIAAAINSSAGRAVQVADSGRAGGSQIVFSGAIDEDGSGIDLNNNDNATITFSGSLDIDAPADASIGFSSQNGGNVTVTGPMDVNTTAGTGAAISLLNNTGSTISFTSSGAGLDVHTASGTGIIATGGGTINVTGSSNTLATTTGRILNWDGVSVGASGVSFTSLQSTANVPGTPISLNNVDGTGNTFNGGNVAITTVSTSGSDGLAITGGSAATFTFGTVTIGSAVATIVDDGVVLSGANGSVTIASLTVNNTTGNGIEISNNTSLIDIQGGSIGNLNDSSGTGVAISGGSANVTIAAGINKSTLGGSSVSVSGRTAGTVTFSGAITHATATIGIDVQNNTGGTTTFSGSAQTLGTTTATAVNLNANAGHTINFTGGGLAITTTSGTGFDATGGATAVTVTGSNNTISSSASTALNVVNTTIGASGLTFRSIASGTSGADSSATGIILDTTGASGGLTITGSGTAGSGGTIQRKTGADGSTTTGIGIYLNSTTNPSFTRMILRDFQNYAIRGLNVSGFTLDNSTVDISAYTANGTSNASDEGSVSFGARAPASANGLTGAASITNSVIRDGYEDNLSVFNVSGTLNLTVNNSIIRNTGGTVPNPSANVGNDGIIVELHSTATANVDVKNTQFIANGGDHFNATANDSANLNVQFGNNGANTLSGGHTAPLGQSLLIQAGGQWSGSGSANISNNSITGAVDTPINLNIGGTGTFVATVHNNTIGTSGVAGSGTVGNEDAIHIVANGDKGALGAGAHGGTFTAAVTNNTIQQVSGRGIFAIGRDGGSASDPIELNLTITGNVFRQSPNSGGQGIRVESGASSTPTPDRVKVHADIGGAGAAANVFEDDWGTNLPGGTDFDEIRIVAGPGINQFILTNLGADTSVSGVATYLAGRNSLGAGGVASANVGSSGNVFSSGGTPPQPLLAAEGGVEPAPTPGPVSGPPAPPQQEQPPAAEPPATGSGIPSAPPVPQDQPPATDSGIPSVPPLGAPVADDGILSDAELRSIVDAAMLLWCGTGLTDEQYESLRLVTFVTADLPNAYLGEAGSGQIRLDVDAAGHGWFVDPTPLDNVEFVNVISDTRLRALSSAAPAGRIDLLTTVMHEMGHVVGLEDSYSLADRESLMYGFLVTGERRLPASGQANGAVPGHEPGLDFLGEDVDVTIGTLPAGKTITITFQATVDTPFLGGSPQVSTQGVVDYTDVATPFTKNTNDPDTGAADDATVTAIAAPEINVRGNAVSIVDGDAMASLTDHTDFGSADILVGSVTRTFTIENIGTDTLDVSNITITGADQADFTFSPTPTLPANVAASNGTFTFTIIFNPSTTGTKNATVTITNDDATEGSYDFAIQGLATAAPEIDVRGQGNGILDGDTTPIAGDDTEFGSRDVSLPGVDHVFTIFNSGSADLNLTLPITVTSPSGGFTIFAQPASSVAPGGNTTFTVRFDPSVIGPETATVNIGNDDSNENPYNFDVHGTGTGTPEIDVKGNGTSIVTGDMTPEAADDTHYGSVDLLAAAVVHEFTIFSDGTGPLALSSTLPRVTLSGDTSQFVVTQQPSLASVPTGTSVTFKIAFDPTSVGLKAVTVSIPNDDADENPYEFLLHGQAVSTPDMDVQGLSNSIPNGDTTPSIADDTDFGAADIRDDSFTHTFTIANVGSQTLTLDGAPRVAISGHTGDFIVTMVPGSDTIDSLDATTFVITFNPTATGLRSAVVSIASDDPDEDPYTFTIQGTGTSFVEMDVQNDAQTLSIPDNDTSPIAGDGTDFGDANVASQSVVRSYYIVNTGSGPLNLSGSPVVQVTGGNSGDFIVSQPSSGVVAPGASLFFSITFNPSANGLRSTTVTIANDDPNENPYDFKIQGTGFSLPTNPAAYNVLGQPDLTHNDPGATATTLFAPSDVAVDPTSGKVFVADSGNSRILRYSSVAAVANGAAAEAVFGQSTFTDNAGGATESKMSFPSGLFVDAAGRLWVADLGNNRVLRFDNAATLGDNPAANGVLGQISFTGTTSSLGANGMANPNDVYVDAAGRLWVADSGNSRVLRFDDAANKVDGANADGVLGQDTFDTSAGAAGPDGLVNPIGVYGDSAGRLWVSDTGHDRVLRFDNAAAKTNGANADGVLGHANFTELGASVTQSTMNSPGGLTGDATGTLYVSDRLNHRVLVFNDAAAKTNGAEADDALGQPTYVSATANNGGLSATSLNRPIGLTFDVASSALYVADSQNNRVKRYGPPPAPEMDVRGGSPQTSIPAGDTTPIVADSTDFGSAELNFGTVSRTFTIYNFGSDTLSLNPTIAFNNGEFGDFTVTSPPASSVAPGSSTTFTIKFDPSAAGARSTTVSIANSDSDEDPYEFLITGTGITAPEMEVRGNGLEILDEDVTPAVADGTDFGSAELNTGVVERTFTINNLGSATLSLSGSPTVAVVGANPGDFTVTVQPASTSLAAQTGTTTFTVTFNPTASGPRSATISIANNDPNENPYDFDVTGTGALAPEMDVRGQATSIADGDVTPDAGDDTAFGQAEINTGFVDHVFTIHNLGSAALGLTDAPLVKITGADAADFSVTVQPANSVTANGGMTTFTVRFNPGSSGAKTATVTIANDDGDENPYDFAISGTGLLAPEIDVRGQATSIPDDDVSPTTADDTDFGNAELNLGFVDHTFTIHNLGSATLNLNGSPIVQISGTNAADFTVFQQPASAAVAANTGTVTFVVRFNPSAAGPRTATVSIANDDSNEATYDFAIQGTGITAPEIDVRGQNVSIASGDTTPSATDDTNFGFANITGGQVDHTFTIHNLGSATLNLNGTPRVTISGAGMNDFTVTTPPAATVGPNGATTTFVVRFDPVASGTRKATISIANDDGNENPYTFDIQGTSDVGLPYGPIDFSTLEPGPQLSGDWQTPVGSFGVQGQQLAGNGSLNLALVNLVNPAADVFVEAKVNALALNEHAGLVARYVGVGERNMYLGAVSNRAEGLLASIWKNVNGVWTRLVVKNLGAGTGGLLRFEVVGDSLKVLFNGQVAVFTNDSSLTAPGLVGVRGSAQSAFDDFRSDALNPIPVIFPATIDFQSQEPGPQLSERWIEALGNFGVQSNRLQGNAASPLNLALLDLASPAADVLVEANVNALATNEHAGLLARYSGVGDRNTYLGALSNTAAGLLASIWKNVNGVWTRLVVKNLGAGTGGLLRFEVVGDSLKILFNGQVAVFTNDSSLTAAGLVGVRGSAQSAFDDFHADALNRVSAAIPYGPINFQTQEPGPQLSEQWIEALGNFGVQSNQLQANPSSPLNVALVNVPSSTANGFVQANVTAPSVNEQVGLLARYSGPGDANGYLAALSNVGGGNNLASIWKNVGGTWTRLASVNVGALNGGLLRFEYSGSMLTLKFNNNPAFTISIMDNSFAAGLIGVRGSKNGLWDDFSAG